MNADRINKQMLQIEIGEKGTPLFYTETVNIVGQYRRLKRKPTRKLINYFVQLKQVLYLLHLNLINSLLI